MFPGGTDIMMSVISPPNPLRTRTLLTFILLAAGSFSLLAVVPVLPPAWGADEAGSPKPASKLPPLKSLKVDKSAPLLLDEPTAEEGKDQAFLRINEACYVCHGNYREEPMAVSHAKQDVSCMECHGPSLEHRNDEDNITPPDKMYALAKIDAGCQADCHDSHDAPAREVLKRWQERCPDKTDVSQVVCTDCHGFHRLTRRTVQWDKDTGKLLLRSPKKEEPTTPKPSQSSTP
jgi:hypothetical protein